MNVARIYLETTIFNRYFDVDRKYHEETKLLFEAIQNNKFVAFTSSYAIGELKAAPEPKSTKMIDLIMRYGITILDAAPDIRELANIYIAHGIIPLKYAMDAIHIAAASFYHMDCIVSLNFRHINKLQTKIKIESVNHISDYNNPIICAPMEVLYDKF
jgi:predicted nucleic acid-binding protein